MPPTTTYLTGVLMVAFVVLQFYFGPYKRLGHEALKQPLMDPESAFNSDTINPAHPEDNKLASALVRVTSMDSGGSGNGSNQTANADLSLATSSIGMWNVRESVAAFELVLCAINSVLLRLLLQFPLHLRILIGCVLFICI